MKFLCIGGEDEVRGFRLAGVEGSAPADAAQAAEALERAAADPECGVLLIARGTAGLVRARLDELRISGDRPLIIEI